VSVVEVAIVDGVATITLNRPDTLNPFTEEVEAELIAAFDRTDADDDVKAVILTGAGRAFCAGMDLSGGGGAFEDWRSSNSAPDGSQVHVGGEELPMRRDGAVASCSESIPRSSQ
jgi:enoyl-CoA hydratase/carnithine racemase